MGDLREPDGGAAAGDDKPSRSPWTSVSSNSNPSSIGPETWDRAEKAVQKIIFKVQPTVVSEERRKKVLDYVQSLMRTSTGCVVFPYGSVPLKTYLPDGDIDLTAVSGLSSDDVLVKDVISVLQTESQNNAAEFVVKDVQHIGAEVKIVKCIVQNIVVDITFNQIGGLCTLCFLEQVDRLIGKENLFKRSIILIKAWCYYESRILGGHHGLISTYALETLVLYIFHLFNESLNGPLAVLYKFLDYYSKFDWENYCISIFGAVRISSLPDFVVETPDYGGGTLSLGPCVDMFSVASKGIDSNSRTFQTKYLNIVDPLKKTNNLGRCVNQGSFFRIRSAFTYGSKKLGQILMEPENDIDEGLYKFFSNTLDRHGSGQRPDVQGPIRVSSFGPAWMVSETESYQMDRVIPQTESMRYFEIMEDWSTLDGSFHNAIADTKASGGENRYRNNNKGQEGTVGVLSSKMLGEAEQTMMGKALDERIFGDAEDLATSRFESLNLIAQESAAPVGAPYYVPHRYHSNSMLSYGDKGNPSSHKIQMGNCKKGVSCGSDVDNGFGTGNNDVAGEDAVPISAGLEDVLAKNEVSHPENLHCVSLDSASASRSTSESLNPLPDLTGDYDSHYKYLLYGWSCCQYVLGMPPLPTNALPPYLFQSKNLWDSAQQSCQFNQNGFTHASVNGAIPGPAFYTINPLLVPGVFLGLEEVPKPRGTGTYLPSMQNRSLRTYRHSPAKGRNQASSRYPHNNNRNIMPMENNVQDHGNHELPAKGRNQASSRYPHNNNQNIMPMENNVQDHSNHELPQSQLSVDQSSSKPGNSDVSPSFSPRGKVHPKASALVLQSHGGFEFSSARHAAASLSDKGKQSHQKSPTSSPKNSGPVSPPNGMQGLKPVRDYDRLSMKSSYHLKDDEDFPPLSL